MVSRLPAAIGEVRVKRADRMVVRIMGIAGGRTLPSGPHLCAPGRLAVLTRAVSRGQQSGRETMHCVERLRTFRER